MKELLNNNFNPEDIEDNNFDLLFSERRRDSSFAFVYERDGDIFAVRDHLGTVPLYYSKTEDGFKFSTNLTEMAVFGKDISMDGLKHYLGFGTAKLYPLLKHVQIVPPGSVLKFKESGQVENVFQYKVKPKKLGNRSKTELVNEMDSLFFSAVKRSLKTKKVGLYLSGGIDSAMIGVYLKKMDVKINAYSSAPWGKTSSEIPYTKRNAEIIGVDSLEIDYLESCNYSELLSSASEIYQSPQGTTTSIGITSLWKNTGIGMEELIYSGQNNDTINCGMGIQYEIYFANFLPRIIQRKLGLPYNDLIRNYFFRSSKGFVDAYPDFYNHFEKNKCSSVQRISLAGIFVTPTPGDGDVLFLPQINRGKIIADPYYDVDFVEFCLGIPFKHKLGFSMNSRSFLAFEKNLFRLLALKYFPKDIVYRKKGLTVSFDRDEKSRKLASLLPKKLMGMNVIDLESRVSAHVFLNWAKQNQVNF